ncbi:hypothetical protein HK405_012417, partial [Cladochytrium tenue]
MAAANGDADAPAVIRLLDSTGQRVLDSVAAEYEDSFCLESFGDLIAAHAAAGDPPGARRLILARVQTWDHKQPGRAYYSYYNAFHLNKILFNTQVYLGKRLLHRLRVLNPLTNTDIIGNVQYFLVSNTPNPTVAAAQPPAPADATDVDVGAAAVVAAGQSVKKAERHGERSPTLQVQESRAHGHGHEETQEASPLWDPAEADHHPHHKRPNLPSPIRTNFAAATANAHDPLHLLLPADIPPSSPSVKEAELGPHHQSWTLAGPSSAAAAEDEFRDLKEPAPPAAAAA